MIIYQGNTYTWPVLLKINQKSVTNRDVKKVEFTFGKVVKMYPKDVEFSDGNFIVSLTQEDTFSFDAGLFVYHARVLFNDGSVKMTEPTKFKVVKSESKEVLK
jgi:hypothetical protein